MDSWRVGASSGGGDGQRGAMDGIGIRMAKPRRRSRLKDIGEKARAAAVREAIEDAVRRARGDLEKAADLLNLSRGNLYHAATHAKIDLPALVAKYRPA